MDNFALSGFVLLFLTQIVKAGDLLLRPGEKQKIQSFVKQLAEKLNAVKPFNVLGFLNTGTGIAILAAPLIVLLIATTANMLHEFVTERIGGWQWSLTFAGEALFALFTLIFGLWFLGAMLYKGWRKGIGMMLTESTTRSFLRGLGRIAGRLILSSIPLVACMAYVIRESADEPGSLWIAVAMGALLVFTYFGYPMAAPFLSGLLAILIWIFAIAGNLILAFVRRLVNNIAEYQKGALEAILLILTIALGILTGYLKFLDK